MGTPIVDLTRIDAQIEISVRAGNVGVPQARDTMQTNYKAQDTVYPDTIGLSVVLRPGATYVDLAHRNSFRHKKLSYATIGTLESALGKGGYGMLLYITPDLPLLPDHHLLAITVNGVVQRALPDDAADTMIAALSVVDNPYPRP